MFGPLVGFVSLLPRLLRLPFCRLVVRVGCPVGPLPVLLVRLLALLRGGCGAPGPGAPPVDPKTAAAVPLLCVRFCTHLKGEF